MSSLPAEAGVQAGMSAPKKNPTVVVVVGAGFAGIAAAAALREGGVSDVTVLEAQDSPGGRVRKIPLDEGFLEPGAQFIHGERGNYLYELAEKYSLLLDKDLYQSGETSDSSAEDYRNNQFLTSDGRVLQPVRAARLLRTINEIFRDYANSFFYELEKDSQLSAISLNHAADLNNILLSHDTKTMDRSDASAGLADSALDSNRLPPSRTTSKAGGFQQKDGCGGGAEVALYALSQENDYVINYGSAADEDGRKEEKTFTEVLKKSRERILQAGEEPEEVKLAILKWMEQWEYTDNAARLEDLSLEAYGKYGYVRGYGLTLTSSGLEDVFNAFLKDSLPQESLLLNRPVKTIFWAQQDSEPAMLEKKVGDNSNQVRCDDGKQNDESKDGQPSNTQSNPSLETKTPDPQSQNDRLQRQNKPIKLVCENGEEFWADHVIVTSSIGYLKKHESSLFEPPLPERLREAVHQMGFGVVAKVFLVWDDLDEVLGPEVEGVQLLWVDGQPVRPPSDKTARKTQTGGNWYDFLQGFERVASHEGTLMTWLAGEEAEIMATLPEQEVKDVLYEIMVQFVGNPQLPSPKQVVRSMWHSNPYILGSYSYIPVHMKPETHDLLSLPLPSLQNPVLQLCGEATSRRFYSSVHGAIDSGRRAARAILRHHLQQRQPTSHS